jgi:hypothetical protein
MITSKRCELCGLYGCRHVNPRLPREPVHGSRRANLTTISPAFPVGEHIGDAMEDYSGTAVDITEKKISTIPMGPNPENTSRTIIPPPPALPSITPVNKELQQIDMKDQWVHCNICKARVFIKYLDQHLKVHTHNFEPSSTTSTAIVKSSGVTSSFSSRANDVTSSSSYTSTFKKPEEKPGPTLNKLEHYRFRELEQACCASSVSNDGRYSDFTIVFWEKDKPSVQSTTYAGGSTTYTTKDWERFSVHVVYDSAEDYYTITCKLLRRASYGTWDNEDTIPDRVCFQEELIPEIKKALLFFRISPKDAYKHFLDLCKEPLVTSYDEGGRAFITQTKNCDLLQERLKKSTNTGWTGGGGSYMGHDYD